MEKGITLVALVITIIILVIITGVTIGATGLKGNIKLTKSNLAIAELSEVQQAVLETYIKYKQTHNKNNIVGTGITYNEATQYANEISNSINLTSSGYDLDSDEFEKFYYMLTPQDLEKIGINGCENTYIVNYYTGEVLNYTLKQTSDGQVLYINAQ